MAGFKEAADALAAAIEAEKSAADDDEAERLHEETVTVSASVLGALPETAEDVATGLQLIRELCVDGEIPASEQLPRHLIEASIAALRLL